MRRKKVFMKVFYLFNLVVFSILFRVTLNKFSCKIIYNKGYSFINRDVSILLLSVFAHMNEALRKVVTPYQDRSKNRLK